MTLSNKDSRYPFTYSADHIRGMADPMVLSRSDASRIVTNIAEILGIDATELKQKIADDYIEMINKETT